MLKRQDSSLSASRSQTAAAATPLPETHRAKAVGCMSGIVQLFSKYQNSNRRIAFGRRHVKRKTSSLRKGERSAAEDGKPQNLISDTNRLICDKKVPRSPTIPPEIRRLNSPRSGEESRTQSSLVAKLIGLEDIGAAADIPAAFEDDLIAKKRQRLVQALEKCNEDLEALKKIIKALQSGEVKLDLPPRGPSGGGNGDSLEVESCVICTDEEAEERGVPLCTVAELTPSTVSGFSAARSTNAALQVIPQQRKPTATKKPGEDDELPIAKLLNKSPTFTTDSFSLLLRRRAAAAMASQQSSKAMVKSVEEVCGDIAWGEKREIHRIGIALHDHVCRELIEEFVKEMMIKYSCSSRSSSSSSSSYSLPLEACKKRLCF